MTPFPFSPGDLLKPNPSAFFGCFHFLDLGCVGKRVDGYVSRTYPLDSLFLVMDCFLFQTLIMGPELSWPPKFFVLTEEFQSLCQVPPASTRFQREKFGFVDPQSRGLG